MTPARLHKQEQKSNITMTKITKILEQAILRHPTLFLTLFLVLITVLFFAVIFTICGISAVESGGMRNFVNGGYI